MDTTTRPPARRRLRAGLAAAALTVATAPLTLTATPAHALSCVGIEEVAQDAEQVFTGRIIDTEGNQILVEVDHQRAGDPIADQVWLPVDLVGWISWPGVKGSDDMFGEHAAVPEGAVSDTRWLFATTHDADGRSGRVNACSMWPLVPPKQGGYPDKYVDPVLDTVDQPVTPGATGWSGVEPPESTGHSDGTLALSAAAGVGLGGAVLVGWGLLRRRRSVA